MNTKQKSNKQFAQEYLDELNQLTGMNFVFRKVMDTKVGIKDWEKTQFVQLRSNNYNDLGDSIQFVIDMIKKAESKGSNDIIESIYGKSE
jgi:hypothetical protein